MTGWALVAAGAVLALPQLVADRPWQLAFACGLALMFAGAVMVADRAPRR